jgi:tetratricopeptide (TPR) repeat protein
MKKTVFSVITLSILLISSALAAQTAKPKQSETFKKAETYFIQKKFDMAEVLLQEELRKNPENAVAYAYLGDIFLEKKQYDGAMSLYRKAIELNGSDARNYYQIGNIYYYKQQGDLAIENYRKANQMDPKLKFAFYHIGYTYLMLLRDKNSTISNWEHYLQIAPEDPQYEKIRRVIELLRDPNFVLPPIGSDISIEEALHLGGAVLQKGDAKTTDTSAGHEGKKTINKTEDIFRDDALQ